MTETLLDGNVIDPGFDPGVLDLSGADTEAAKFDPIPANRYELVVWEAEWLRTKETSTGALGPNCPYINIQLRVNSGEFKNRTVFTTFYPVAPDGYDATKKARNQGAFVNFLVALGFDEATVKSPQFKIDFDQWKGRPFIGVVSKDPLPRLPDMPEDAPTEFRNNLKGFHRIGDAPTASQVAASGAAQLM